ncbi:MAG TPA: sodium/solute symporter [Anaerohalosphaeraceae bacterium]|mgnify:CR=1 FL=1|nr:sodium/solute symporter [Anaerohalosphaeraceae bacterium]HPP55568.1 sodium/solute symporter [Anaerohalosphaeraceae bacterium]
MGILDVIVFVVFVVCVVGLGLYKSRHEQSGEDYFLAGRGLVWWLIGFSLIAANISSEQFVGMSGNAASHIGMAIASYEWMAAITLVVVAFGFLPYFLRAGIYTMPEFLEYRYNTAARTIMAVTTIFIYMLLLGAVTYSGALTINTMAEEMGMSFVPTVAQASLVIGIIAMLYVAAGGLKACAWADLIQGSALIVGGAVIMIFAFKMLGNVQEASYIEDVSTGAVGLKTFTGSEGVLERFVSLNKVRLNMFLPMSDATLPWTALLLGLWIPNFYYWGLNQYITQRTLGSASLAEGQKGIVFSAFMKLLIPFVIVIPGIIAFNLFAPDMKSKAAADNAPVLAKYKIANPNTQLVQVVPSPTPEMLTSPTQGGFLVAVFPNEAALEANRVKNPFVLPITQDKYSKLQVQPFTVFESDDKSWRVVFPALAAELDAYNASVRQAAQSANAKVVTEKFLGYKYDSALGQLLSKVLPKKTGLVGFVLAALLGAIVSSLAAMLNAASTIFTMDIYKKYLAPNASQKAVVALGRICVVAFTAVAVFLAPQLGNPKISNSIFTIIQESQGFLSPGVLAVFVFGLLVRRGPAVCGVAGLVTNFIVYGGLKYVSTIGKLMENQVMAFLIGNFLNRMAISFILCLLVMALITAAKPLAQPVEFRQNTTIQLHSSKGAAAAGVVVVVLTLLLYVIFSPLGLAK